MTDDIYTYINIFYIYIYIYIYIYHDIYIYIYKDILYIYIIYIYIYIYKIIPLFYNENRALQPHGFYEMLEWGMIEILAFIHHSLYNTFLQTILLLYIIHFYTNSLIVFASTSSSSASTYSALPFLSTLI